MSIYQHYAIAMIHTAERHYHVFAKRLLKDLNTSIGEKQTIKKKRVSTRALGTNPRAKGTNPRAKNNGQNDKNGVSMELRLEQLTAEAFAPYGDVIQVEGNDFFHNTLF